MKFPCLILLAIVSCTHSLSFQFAATQSPNNRKLNYGDREFIATCDPTKKCAIDTSSRSTCERLGCCFQNNECFAKNYFIMNQEPSKIKVPLFTVPRKTDGSLLEKTDRATALKYCQDNYPNGQLAVPTATDDWITYGGRIEKFKGVFTGFNVKNEEFHLHADFNHLTRDVTTVDGALVANGDDFELSGYNAFPVFPGLSMYGELRISNGNPGKMYILCQHD